LHLGWILEAKRGRWNTQRPRLPCIYTSLKPQGAIAEFHKHLAEYNAPQRRDLVSINVSVRPVLDLTNPRIVRRLGIDAGLLTGDSQRALVTCRAIARQHVLHGPFRGILAPSAALDNEVNLMIYIESTNGIQSLENGPDRITIGPGYRWSAP
jgi:RES domain-containing protein